MSVTSEQNKIVYVTSGTSNYAVPFVFMAKEHLKVFLNNLEQVLDVDYSVSGEGNEDGGMVNFINTPSSTIDLVILRQVPITQTNSFPENGSFLARTIENMFDKIYHVLQQLNEVSERSIRFPVSSAKNPQIANIVEPGRVIVTNEDANGLEMGPILSDFETSLANKQSAAEAAQLASEQARDLSVAAKENSQTIKEENQTIKEETQTIKEETLSIKESIEPIASGYPQAREELTNLQSLVGISAFDADLGVLGANYIPNNSTVKDSVIALDNTLKSANDSIVTHETRVTNIEAAYVSKTGVQEVSNKTIINSSIENTVKLVSKKDTYANLETHAATAEEGEEVFATDLKKKYFIAEGVLKQAGGGGNGSLGSIVQFTGEDLRNWTINTVDFELNKTTPMYGEASYKMTLKPTVGSVISPLIPITKSLRDMPLALLLDYLYNGSNGDVVLKVLDQTGANLTQFNLPLEAAITTKTAKQFINIPSSVTGIRIELDNYVVNSGKIFEFDKLEVTTDLLSSVVVKETQGEILLNVGNLTQTTNLGTFSSLSSTGFKGIYSKTSQGIIFHREATVSVGYTVDAPVAGSIVSVIYLNGTTISGSATSSQAYSQTPGVVVNVKTGDKITFAGTGASGSNSKVSISATASNPEILSPVNQISSDDLNWQFKAGAIVDSDPIGTFNTSVYAGGGNTRTLATTPPTQSYESMRQNGPQLFVRAYNAASAAAQPARFDIKIGRDLIGPSRGFIKLFKNSGKLIEGNTEIVRFPTDNTTREGFEIIAYDQNTGILTIDAGFSISSAVTAPRLSFSDGSNVTNGYVTFTASKAPVIATIPMAKRYIVNTYQSGTDWWEVNNDGWVRQGKYVDTGGAPQTVTFLIPMLNTNYTIYGAIRRSDTSAATAIYQTNTTTSISLLASTTNSAHFIVEGYGNSAAVRALSATPNY